MHAWERMIIGKEENFNYFKKDLIIENYVICKKGLEENFYFAIMEIYLEHDKHVSNLGLTWQTREEIWQRSHKQHAIINLKKNNMLQRLGCIY